MLVRVVVMVMLMVMMVVVHLHIPYFKQVNRVTLFGGGVGENGDETKYSSM